MPEGGTLFAILIEADHVPTAEIMEGHPNVGYLRNVILPPWELRARYFWSPIETSESPAETEMPENASAAPTNQSLIALPSISWGRL